MIPLLERLLWRSPLGQQIKQDAMQDAEGEEKQIRARIAEHELSRDLRTQGLMEEMTQLKPELDELRAQQAVLEQKVLQLHRRVVIELPSQMEDAHRVCGLNCQPLYQAIKDLAEVKQALRPDAVPHSM